MILTATLTRVYWKRLNERGKVTQALRHLLYASYHINKHSLSLSRKLHMWLPAYFYHFFMLDLAGNESWCIYVHSRISDCIFWPLRCLCTCREKVTDQVSEEIDYLNKTIKQKKGQATELKRKVTLINESDDSPLQKVYTPIIFSAQLNLNLS